MQLNESTYETIFLSYIDKELSPKACLEVEDFIASNPAYAIEMEALKATVLEQETMSYAFKAQLKLIPADEVITLANIEDLDADWDQTYKNAVVADMQGMKGLSIPFKESLKKNNSSKGTIVNAFGFNQNKFTYAAIAACLMVFLGYQQLVPKTSAPSALSGVSDLPTKAYVKNEQKMVPTNRIEKTRALVNYTIEPSATRKEQIELSTTNTMPIEPINNFETTSTFSNANHSSSVEDVQPSSEVNKVLSNATPTLLDVAKEIETTEDKGAVAYELIDTEEPNRSIYIANFEIDGNRLRGLKRKVTSLFKGNKSEPNKK